MSKEVESTDDAKGSVVLAIKQILLLESFHLTPRQVWDQLRIIFPKKDKVHWVSGGSTGTFLINVALETREQRVYELLEAAVQGKPDLAAAIGWSTAGTDSERVCVRRICGVWEALKAETRVLHPTASKPRAPAAARGRPSTSAAAGAARVAGAPGVAPGPTAVPRADASGAAAEASPVELYSSICRWSSSQAGSLWRRSSRCSNSCSPSGAMARRITRKSSGLIRRSRSCT